MRRIALALTSAVTVGLVALGATAASAEPLPSGDSLYALVSNDVAGSVELYSVSPNGESTLIVSVPGIPNGTFAADYDSTTGLAYFTEDLTAGGCTLYSIDPSTGAYVEIGDVSDAVLDECDAVSVDSAGVLRIADENGGLLVVNKATGATISAASILGAPRISFIEQSSTGEFYLGGYDGGVYTIDVDAAFTTFLWQPTLEIEAAALDQNDRLWFAGPSVDNCSETLNSVQLNDPSDTAVYEGDFVAGVECLNAFALFIVPGETPAEEPELAATGPTSIELMVPFAALALVLGAGAILVSRRTRTASQAATPSR